MTSTRQDSATRDRIHRIAAELFARNGYHATGMAELSQAVQLGRGALYYHITSKESVLYAISMGAIDQLIGPAREIAAHSDPAPAKIRALARELMKNIAAYRNEWTVFFREHVALTGDWHDEIMRSRDAYEALWWNVLDEGVQRGELIPIEPIVTKGILGMFNYSHLWLRPDGEISPEQVADRFAEVLISGLVPRPKC
jgi:AcrR family transcriptional regulator